MKQCHKCDALLTVGKEYYVIDDENYCFRCGKRKKHYGTKEIRISNQAWMPSPLPPMR